MCSEEETTVAADPLKVIRECVVLLTDIKFKNYIKFNDDVTTFLKEGRKKYTCYVCMMKFFTEQDLNNHKSVHDEENVVDIETKDDENDSDYSGNESEETDSEDECDLTFSLDYNREIETNCSLFSCTTCRVTFKTLTELRTHVLVPEKCVFSCKFCIRNFNSSDVFLGHIVHHRINFLSLSFFKCEVCAQCFENYFQLRKHEVVTHNLKPWTDKDKLPPLPHQDSNPKDPKDDLELEIIPKEEPPDQDLSEAADNRTMISCELCFDLCNSDDEFATHMEFHRQLAIKESEESDIIDDKIDTIRSEMIFKNHKNFNNLAPRVKFNLKPAPKINPKASTKLIHILPKPNKKPETNVTTKSGTASKSGDVNISRPNLTVATVGNKEQTPTIFVKDILELKNKPVDKAGAHNKVTSSPDKAKPPNIIIKTFDLAAISKKRLLVKREFSGASGKWILPEKDSASIKKSLDRAHQESSSTKNLNAVKSCNTSNAIIVTVPKTTTVRKSLDRSQQESSSTKNVNAVKSCNTSVIVTVPKTTTVTTQGKNSAVTTSSTSDKKEIRPLTGKYISIRKSVPSQVSSTSSSIVTQINTRQISKNTPTVSTSGAPRIIGVNTSMASKVSAKGGTQTVLSGSTNPGLVIPSVITVPPAPNSCLNVPLDKQNVGSIPNNWTNPQGTNAANSNLIYVINPVNNFRVPSEPQMTYLNDTSNFTYFLVPSNPPENVTNISFGSQTPVIQNPYSLPEANKVLYTLPTIDPSLNIVSQRGSSQMSNPVTMPMLSSDNNLYFITNQSNNSVQGSMQSTGVINTIVTQNSLQPNGSVGGRFFTQN